MLLLQVQDSTVVLVSDQNIVDWNMNELDKETNESHDQKPNTGCLGNLHEFLSVWLGALLDQVHGIASKLLEGLHQDLVETFLFCAHFSCCW